MPSSWPSSSGPRCGIRKIAQRGGVLSPKSARLSSRAASLHDTNKRPIRLRHFRQGDIVMKHQQWERSIGALTMGLIATTVLFSAPALAQSQDYPTKAIRIVVPFAPGGGNDILARVIAPRLSESLGKPVIVDNRPGAGGNIGTEMVARAAPDGYTILMASNQVTINP